MVALANWLISPKIHSNWRTFHAPWREPGYITKILIGRYDSVIIIGSAWFPHDWGHQRRARINILPSVDLRLVYLLSWSSMDNASDRYPGLFYLYPEIHLPHTSNCGKGGGCWDMVERDGPGLPELWAAAITELWYRVLGDWVSFLISRNRIPFSGRSLSMDMGSGWPGDTTCLYDSDSQSSIVIKCVFLHFLLFLIGDLLWLDQCQDFLQS
jgi:hypothetical protein